MDCQLFRQICALNDKEMLDKAFAKISDNTNLILHSDQGWQSQHKRYQGMLRKKGVHQYASQR